MKNADYVGTEVNEMKIIEYYIDNKNGRRRPRFKCICVCGKIFDTRAEAIKNGTAKSCGCRTSELMSVARTLEGDAAAINIVYRRYIFTAKRKDIPFELSLEQFTSFLYQNCIYCGSAPKLARVAGSEKWNVKEKFFAYNGIDRIDNNIGYLINNCITCCSYCNRAKSDLTLEEFQAWINRLVLFVSGKDDAR